MAQLIPGDSDCIGWDDEVPEIEIDICLIPIPPPTRCPSCVPEDQCDRVDVVEVGDPQNPIVEIAIFKKVTDLDCDFTSETSGTRIAIVGKQIADSSITAKAVKGDESVIAFNTTKVNNTDIEVKGKGKGARVVNVNTGRFNNSHILFNKKSADYVQFNNGVEVRNVTVDAGRGADIIHFKENSFIKGTNVIYLGKGKDILQLPANKKGKGTINVTDLMHNDTIIIGDESFSGKDINKGEVYLPGYIVIGQIIGHPIGCDVIPPCPELINPVDI